MISWKPTRRRNRAAKTASWVAIRFCYDTACRSRIRVRQRREAGRNSCRGHPAHLVQVGGEGYIPAGDTQRRLTLQRRMNARPVVVDLDLGRLSFHISRPWCAKTRPTPDR